jgi:hypothetical protein
VIVQIDLNPPILAETRLILTANRGMENWFKIVWNSWSGEAPPQFPFPLLFSVYSSIPSTFTALLNITLLLVLPVLVHAFSLHLPCAPYYIPLSLTVPILLTIVPRQPPFISPNFHLFFVGNLRFPSSPYPLKLWTLILSPSLCSSIRLPGCLWPSRYFATLQTVAKLGPAKPSNDPTLRFFFPSRQLSNLFSLLNFSCLWFLSFTYLNYPSLFHWSV